MGKLLILERIQLLNLTYAEAAGTYGAAGAYEAERYPRELYPKCKKWKKQSLWFGKQSRQTGRMYNSATVFFLPEA